MSSNQKNRLATPDAIKYRKDCPDFICLNDGTIYRECRYCELSLKCRQVDIVDGETVPMESHFCPVVDPVTNEIVTWEYYCTGMYDNRPLDERVSGDDKIS